MCARRRSRDFRRNEDAIIGAIDAYHRMSPPAVVEATVAAPYRWKLSECAVIRRVTAAWNHYFPHLTGSRK